MTFVPGQMHTHACRKPQWWRQFLWISAAALYIRGVKSHAGMVLLLFFLTEITAWERNKRGRMKTLHRDKIKSEKKQNKLEFYHLWFSNAFASVFGPYRDHRNRVKVSRKEMRNMSGKTPHLLSGSFKILLKSTAWLPWLGQWWEFSTRFTALATLQIHGENHIKITNIDI